MTKLEAVARAIHAVECACAQIGPEPLTLDHAAAEAAIAACEKWEAEQLNEEQRVQGIVDDLRASLYSDQRPSSRELNAIARWHLERMREAEKKS